MQWQDVRMSELCCYVDLLYEPIRTESSGEFWSENLQRHLSVMLHVLGQIKLLPSHHYRVLARSGSGQPVQLSDDQRRRSRSASPWLGAVQKIRLSRRVHQQESRPRHERTRRLRTSAQYSCVTPQSCTPCPNVLERSPFRPIFGYGSDQMPARSLGVVRPACMGFGLSPRDS